MNFYVYRDNFQTVTPTEENKTWVSNSCEKLVFRVWVRIAAADYWVKERDWTDLYFTWDASNIPFSSPAILSLTLHFLALWSSLPWGPNFGKQQARPGGALLPRYHTVNHLWIWISDKFHDRRMRPNAFQKR